MWAPNHVAMALYRLNPSARLAWAGEPGKTEDELNAGSFALVQLYPIHQIGSLEEPLTPEELWHVTTRADEHGQPCRVRIDRGPIFNRHGGTRPDWDPIFFVPVFKVRFKDYHMSNESVQSGAILPLLRRWMTPIKKRVQDSQEAAGKELKRKAREIGEEGGKRLWKEAMNHDSTSKILPYDASVRKEVDQFFQGNEGIENYYKTGRVMR